MLECHLFKIKVYNPPARLYTVYIDSAKLHNLTRKVSYPFLRLTF